MTTFQKSSLTSDNSAYCLAKMLFGLDHADFDIALNNLNERCFQPIAQIAKIRYPGGTEKLSIFVIVLR